MRRLGSRVRGGAARAILAALPVLIPAFALAATVRVTPGGEGLQAELARAGAGGTVVLAPGVYHGPLVVRKTVTLRGEPGAIVDGGGKGNVITVAAPDVVIRGLTVRNSGTSLAGMNAGIFVGKEGDRALIEDNDIDHNLFGIYFWGPDGAVARHNRIVGRRDPHMNERGNGFQLWNTPGSKVIDNDVRYGRDGIFVTTSRNNTFAGNRFRDLRFAIHYMYTNHSRVVGNDSRGNHAGYVLMFSDHIEVAGNRSRGDRDHGILFNYANYSDVHDNVVVGGDQCGFVYNSNHNRIADNRFEGCNIGIHFTAGSEDNGISGNAFVANRVQAKYVGTRWMVWSENGRGNYWSDNPAVDLNGDGVADAAYRPNGMIDEVVWAHPLAKLLVTSPALQLLRMAEAQFPGIHPGGVVDKAPLMQPPAIRTPEDPKGEGDE